MSTKSNSGRRILAINCDMHGVGYPRVPRYGDIHIPPGYQVDTAPSSYDFSRVRLVVGSQFPAVLSAEPAEWLVVADQLEDMGNVQMANVLRLEAELVGFGEN